jgi:S-adenosyl-L-methionine hydrolase (adenosine-forming)
MPLCTAQRRTAGTASASPGSNVPPLVTVTTDFGTRDPYAAAIKGIIYQSCAGVQVVDLTHDIAHGDILEGALFLAGAAPCFPHGTIHCVVVDPGVGTGRVPIVVSAGGQAFVCPDNGLLTLVLRDHALAEARAITNPRFMRDHISATFHGRDVFAPTAGLLARGLPLHAVGEPVDRLMMLDIPSPTKAADRIHGEVIHIDRFGNAITNIPRAMVGEAGIVATRVGKHAIDGLQRTYGDVPDGQPLVLFGSTQHIEIAVNAGDAATALGLARNSTVEVILAQ